MLKKARKPIAPTVDMMRLHVETMCSADHRGRTIIAPIAAIVTFEAVEAMGEILQANEWTRRVV